VVSSFTKMAAFDRASSTEGLWHRRCAFSRAGKFPRGAKSHANWKKGTKLLKRIWKAVVYIQLVMVAGALLFASQYFSWDVFMSHVNQQATAATSTRPR
jgi:hypothetical protein